ncbi:hypothetical protein BDY19DRAFT_907583 [Irpex rosettiformis]|uniref:Uncharacterized protein n=1 Tax=Irpex rosettiformis TaxID=378272 RepID=A0ACB8TZP0_9APHY|nr:hypothetical protein BDY19DRAFT_907583 [Irpex rosettiformis]
MPAATCLSEWFHWPNHRHRHPEYTTVVVDGQEPRGGLRNQQAHRRASQCTPSSLHSALPVLVADASAYPDASNNGSVGVTGNCCLFQSVTVVLILKLSSLLGGVYVWKTNNSAARSICNTVRLNTAVEACWACPVWTGTGQLSYQQGYPLQKLYQPIHSSDDSDIQDTIAALAHFIKPFSFAQTGYNQSTILLGSLSILPLRVLCWAFATEGRSRHHPAASARIPGPGFANSAGYASPSYRMSCRAHSVDKNTFIVTHGWPHVGVDTYFWRSDFAQKHSTRVDIPGVANISADLGAQDTQPSVESMSRGSILSQSMCSSGIISPLATSGGPH